MGAAALILSLVVGYVVWRTAQEGIVRMQGDVANAVKLETVRAHTRQTAPHIQEDVQTVTFKGDKAMAAVLVTNRLPNGHAVVRPETHFYLLTAKRLAANAPPGGVLGTGRDAGYRQPALRVWAAPTGWWSSRWRQVPKHCTRRLRRATGEDLATAGLLTVELVPDELLNDEQAATGHIRLASPTFTDRGVPLPRGDIFALLQLRHALARRLLDIAVQKSTPLPQWATLGEAFSTWLQLSDAVQPAPPSELAALQRLGSGTKGVLRLQDLLDGEGQPASGTRTGAYQTYEAVYTQGQRWAAAEQIIDFLADKYGIDVLPKLLRGFGEYDDWETLAPAVLGVSAADLEAAWRGQCGHGPRS